MGNTVTAISTSPNKEAAAKEIGADKYVLFHRIFAKKKEKHTKNNKEAAAKEIGADK